MVDCPRATVCVGPRWRLVRGCVRMGVACRFLQDEQMFAVAQKKYTYIYDARCAAAAAAPPAAVHAPPRAADRLHCVCGAVRVCSGVELHCLREHHDVTRLEFL